ncbi:hypothetical protein INT45_011806 [Circinella minor]|uniref:Uncharacterized protein n=1 Tax=Circinella minor TaxID=1195481 RepID=A0A8H7SAT5_9FUNG|nr:hypothetical protein INT45_011806 [Circinella minor]
MSDQSMNPDTTQIQQLVEQVARQQQLLKDLYQTRTDSKALVPVLGVAHLFTKRQAVEDASLHNFQYTLSTVLFSLDVLRHMLLPISQLDQIERIFAMLNDIHTLILYTEGTINQARNQLALWAVNPSIH